MNVQAFLRWAGVNLLLGSWDNYFATPGELLPLQRRPQGSQGRVHGLAVLHLHPLGLRQQLRHRLLRHPVAVHRHRRLAQQHAQLLGQAGSARQDLSHPAGHEPAAQPRPLPVLPGPPRAPARHRLHARRDLGADRAPTAQEDCGTGCARPPTSRPTLRTRRRSPAASSPTTRSTAPAASRTRSAGETPRSRASSTTCGCAATAPGEQLAALRKDYPSGASGATFSGMLEPLPGCLSARASRRDRWTRHREAASGPRRARAAPGGQGGRPSR